MRQLRAFFLRLLTLLRLRPSSDAAEELEAHIAFDTERGIAEGLTPEGARRQALLRLGGLEQARQSYRNRETLPWLDAFVQDTRYAFRTLRHTPTIKTSPQNISTYFRHHPSKESFNVL